VVDRPGLVENCPHPGPCGLVCSAREIAEDPGRHRPLLAAETGDHGAQLLGGVHGIAARELPLDDWPEARPDPLPAAGVERPLFAEHDERGEKEEVDREQREKDPADRREDVVDRKVGHGAGCRKRRVVRSSVRVRRRPRELL